MEDPARIACADLVKWVVTKYGFEEWDAYFLLSEVGKVQPMPPHEPTTPLAAEMPARISSSSPCWAACGGAARSPPRALAADPPAAHNS